jgi:hypothetical protein
MNIKNILSPGEAILFGGQQKRLVPGGKEITPGDLFVTNQRIILVTNSMLGLKHDYEDLHYSDIESILLKRNVFSSDVIIKSRFQGEIHLKAIAHGKAESIERAINERVNNYRYGAGIGPESRRNEDWDRK